MKIKIVKKDEINEEEIKRRDDIGKFQDKIYELTKDVERLERYKDDLLNTIEKLQAKRRSIGCEVPTQDDLFKYCDNINKVSKAKYKEKKK